MTSHRSGESSKKFEFKSSGVSWGAEPTHRSTQIYFKSSIWCKPQDTIQGSCTAIVSYHCLRLEIRLASGSPITSGLSWRTWMGQASAAGTQSLACKNFLKLRNSAELHCKRAFNCDQRSTHSGAYVLMVLSDVQIVEQFQQTSWCLQRWNAKYNTEPKYDQTSRENFLCLYAYMLFVWIQSQKYLNQQPVGIVERFLQFRVTAKLDLKENCLALVSAVFVGKHDKRSFSSIQFCSTSKRMWLMVHCVSPIRCSVNVPILLTLSHRHRNSCLYATNWRSCIHGLIDLDGLRTGMIDQAWGQLCMMLAG